MSRLELHPEGLLERARKHTASSAELEKLESHLMTCRACAFEHAVAADCDRSSAPRPDDDLVLARIRERTMRALAVKARPARVRRISRRFAAFAAVAAVLFVVTAAIGARLVRYLGAHGFGSAAHAPSLPAAVPTIERGGGSQTAPSATADSIAESQPQPPAIELTTRATARAPRSPVDRVRLSEPSSASDLFARANLARRSGDAREAASLYRELQRSFPGSVEELVSRVTLGRLLLDRLGDANGSLTQFDSYLANPSHRGLREEALIGRALALGRLGRAADERAAWTALLAAYPASAYAERARARLSGLR